MEGHGQRLEGYSVWVIAKGWKTELTLGGWRDDIMGREIEGWVHGWKNGVTRS